MPHVSALVAAAALLGAQGGGQVGTFNMAGNTMNGGRIDVAEDTMRSMLDRRPVVMMLQEVCYSQFHHVRAKLNSLYAGAFIKVPGRRCDEGSSFGNSILWRRDTLAVNHVKTYPLGSSPGLEQRQMGCVKSDRPRLVACALHLTDPTDNRKGESQRREMAAAAGTLRGWATKYPVVVGGDLNARPREALMNAMYLPSYGPGSQGIFREVDNARVRDGEPTHKRHGKLDYIFATPGLNPRDGDATKSLRSDHVPLWGTITVG
jgi:endonuclease/exonuclease/phosphatase family metal-dependent hydrolase